MLVDDLDAAREPLEGDGAEDDRGCVAIMKLYMKAINFLFVFGL